LNISKVGIVTKLNNQDAMEAAKKIADFFRSKNVEVFSINNIDHPEVISVSPEKIRKVSLDLVFSVGGDGTTLRTFRMLPNSTPVFSVNIGGTRGILAEIAGDLDIKEQLQNIVKGDCFLDARIRIQAQVGDEILGPALNDIVITRTGLTRTPIFKVCLLDQGLSIRMDGIITATPTGSTGHSLSLGGPIIHEQVNCLMILPIAPVKRIPCLIVNPQEISVTSTHDSKLVIDGQEVYDVKADSRILISRYRHDGIFLRLRKRGITQIAKLGF
jgi:NAD+ kinase